MHGLILISYTEYRTLFLFEGLDPTSNTGACYHLYLSATLKQCFTEFAYLNPSSIMFTCRIHTCDLIGRLFFGKDCKECVDWSVILRIEIVGNLNMT
jgi:hypothetical protein